MRIIILSLFYYVSVSSCYAQVNIWENTACKNKVEITPFLVNGTRNAAVIICPGGSYFWHDSETEGSLVASWLQENGISAFVLNYRTANVPAFITHYRLLFRGNRYPDPQEDLKQAVRYIRERSQSFGVDSSKIGVMGFSAGGHLAMSSVELFEKSDWPNFVVSVYPVVTMIEDCVHKRSRRGLLGDNKVKDEYLKDLLSLERHVPQDSPPVFIVNCKDDPVVNYRNSEILDSALTAQKVPHVYIQYQTGGHGFGGSNIKGTPECRQWRNSFISWFKQLNL